MELRYDYWTGNFGSVKTSLIKSIQRYAYLYDNVKIGITSNPDSRKNKHRSSGQGWQKMIVKYETSSVRYINEMEKLLIDHHWEVITNLRGGGGGPNGSPPYYLYVLVK